uniref:DDE_3 domain-containing protein n=1 Tax=Heterorhabditis bacteriophora TaxID=37862 RepID=A0A1I7XC24_HETBA
MHKLTNPDHQNKVKSKLLSTSYTVKQIADVVKRSGKAIMNSLRNQEEYGTKKSSGRPSKLRRIGRSASMESRTCGIDASDSTMWRILDKCPNIVLSWMKKCSQLTQGDEKKYNLDGVDEQRGLPGCLKTSSPIFPTCRSIKTWLKNNDVDTLAGPQDLNPMKNLWAILVRRIYADNRQFETVKDLQSAICKAWSEEDKSLTIMQNIRQSFEIYIYIYIYVI